jgi:hypothetical protein
LIKCRSGGQPGTATLHPLLQTAINRNRSPFLEPYCKETFSRSYPNINFVLVTGGFAARNQHKINIWIAS